MTARSVAGRDRSMRPPTERRTSLTPAMTMLTATARATTGSSGDQPVTATPASASTPTDGPYIGQQKTTVCFEDD